MGAVYDWTKSYAVGFILLAVVAAGAACYSGLVMGPRRSQPTSLLPVSGAH
jgi:hypothetical protein